MLAEAGPHGSRFLPPPLRPPRKPPAGTRRWHREAPTQQQPNALPAGHFLLWAPVPRGHGGGTEGPHSTSSLTVCPFPALAANVNHFLVGHLRPLPAAWPCSDLGRDRTVLVLPARSLEPAVPSAEHPAKRPLDASRAPSQVAGRWGPASLCTPSCMPTSVVHSWCLLCD